MKKQLNKLRRFFARTGGKKLNAATARDAASASYEDEDNSSRLSGAFVVVLVLHVIALVGVFLGSRAMDRPVAQPVGGKAAAGSLTPALVDRAATTPAAQPKAAPQAPAPAALAEANRATPAPALRNSHTYVVKNGDNLTMIATALGVRPADLRAANDLKGDDLRSGQELNIPDARLVKYTAPVRNTPVVADAKTPSAEKSTPGIYIVKKGDTLSKIAREHGVSYESIVKLNKITDPKKLQLDQKLRIPEKK